MKSFHKLYVVLSSLPTDFKVCVRYGLQIGGVCAPFVWALMLIFSPIAWPIAKLLDYVLGSESGNT